MVFLDGRALAKKMTARVKDDIENSNADPGLGVILVGDDQASAAYVKLKEKACSKVGIRFEKSVFDDTTDEQEIIDAIERYNSRDDIHAILIQLPLPAGFNTQKIIKTMDPHKDVDGFHPANISSLIKGSSTHPKPVLIKAILALLNYSQQPLEDKTVALLTKSSVFTQPLSAALAQEGMVLQKDSASADIIVVAIGEPWSITSDKIKEGAIVIDVGITRDSGTLALKGDVHPDCQKKAGWLTPVPGGVGPVTVACLLENTLALHQLSTNQHKNQ